MAQIAAEDVPHPLGVLHRFGLIETVRFADMFALFNRDPLIDADGEHRRVTWNHVDQCEYDDRDAKKHRNEESNSPENEGDHAGV